MANKLQFDRATIIELIREYGILNVHYKTGVSYNTIYNWTRIVPKNKPSKRLLRKILPLFDLKLSDVDFKS